MLIYTMTRFIVSFLIGLSSALWAETDESRFALVIGNAAYSGEAALANPANDASDMATALASVGWKVTKVINADRKGMNRAVDEFHDALLGTPHSVALLFYAGHGIQISGQNYLIPVGESFESASDVTHDAVSLQAILDTFDDARVSTNVVILDACRDNPFAKKSARSLGGTRGLNAVSKSTGAEGSAILFSTAPGETAQDGTGRNGVFTQALLKYIKSDLPLQLLTGRVAGEVRRLTGGAQVPYSSLSLTDDFYLVPASLRTAVPPNSAQAVPTGAAIAAAAPPPKPVDPAVVKASLEVQKAALIRQRDSGASLQKSGLLDGIGWGGWATSGVGASLVGLGWFTSNAALSAYKASSSQGGFDSARSQMGLANTELDVGLGLGILGLATGVAPLFLVPDISHIEQKIHDIEHKISLLGAP